VHSSAFDGMLEVDELKARNGIFLASFLIFTHLFGCDSEMRSELLLYLVNFIDFRTALGIMKKYC